jgi:hypothetical protein
LYRYTAGACRATRGRRVAATRAGVGGGTRPGEEGRGEVTQVAAEVEVVGDAAAVEAAGAGVAVAGRNGNIYG